jgi:hypothetical protein
MSANVELDHRDSVGIALLSGDVDIAHAGALRKQLLSAIRNDDLGLWSTCRTRATSTAWE